VPNAFKNQMVVLTPYFSWAFFGKRKKNLTGPGGYAKNR
jgi:hypothetical protein